MTRTPALFDANGSVGEPAVGPRDCPTLADRLEHMNRLGIQRSLVWNAEAALDHSLACNERLLGEIENTPGAEGRIVPAMVVSGLVAYERGGVERLVGQMRRGGTGALRFVDVYGRHRLMQCEPVVQAALGLKPFVSVKASSVDSQDLLDFTERFPSVPVVLTEVIWGLGIVAFDLMRRRPNVLLETSWWHTWEGVRMAVEHFGADRVLFGTGYRSHNGAAIAALAHADISEEQRALVAHGNLDQLTGTSTAQATAPPLTGNRLWQRCLASEPLGVDIVDAHGHLGPSAGYLLENQEERDQIPAVLKAMDRLGQKTMIVSGLRALHASPVKGNRWIHDQLKPHADRISIYLGFNPNYADRLVAGFEEWFADPQFVGFKVLCSYWKVQITDPRFEPMWRYADQHRLPVLMHSWTGGADSPAMTRDILAKYPDMSLILGHTGGTDAGRRESEDLAGEFSNVFLEWCGSFPTVKRWEETLKVVPVEQVVYGTDAAAHSISWELGRLLSLDVPEEAIESILGRNMRGVLVRRR